MNRIYAFLCRKLWRRKIVSLPGKKILRKCCICILILETAVLTGRMKQFPISVTRTEEQILIEQKVKDQESGAEKTVYGVQIWLERGEICFYRTLIK